jgi:hypothetical protein
MPNMSPSPLLSKYIPSFYGGKSSPIIWAISVIFKKLPQVKTCPMGKKLSNLVTLIKTENKFQLAKRLGDARPKGVNFGP